MFQLLPGRGVRFEFGLNVGCPETEKKCQYRAQDDAKGTPPFRLLFPARVGDVGGGSGGGGVWSRSRQGAYDLPGERGEDGRVGHEDEDEMHLLPGRS